MALFRAHDIQWLAQKHPRNANQSNNNEYLLNYLLSVEHELLATVKWRRVFEQHHIDEHVQNRWSTTGRIALLYARCTAERKPFEEHHKHHVRK